MWVHDLRHRPGRRGAFLAFLALLDFAYGYTLITGPAPRADLLLPPTAWGVIWLVTGCCCAAGVFTRHDRWPYAAACAMKATWAGVWAFAWLAHDSYHGFVPVAVWGAFAAVTRLIAGWPEAP